MRKMAVYTRNLLACINTFPTKEAWESLGQNSGDLGPDSSFANLAEREEREGQRRQGKENKNSAPVPSSQVGPKN